MDVLLMMNASRLLRIVIRWGGVLLLCLLPLGSAALAAEACRVIDPELQRQYAGPCVEGLAQGNGVAVGAARYSGDFVAGRKHGNGLKVWANGDRYEGAFVADRKQGQGAYRWGAGSEWAGQRYVGAYVADRREGLGTYEWPDGRKLSGQWQADLPSPTLAAQMQTTIRMYAEQMVRVGIPGAKVCRSVPVGISEIDTIIAVVLAVEGDRIRVRIERPGKLGGELDGRTVKSGMELSDYVDRWMVCR
jgi:hypothetical protein